MVLVGAFLNEEGQAIRRDPPRLVSSAAWPLRQAVSTVELLFFNERGKLNRTVAEDFDARGGAANAHCANRSADPHVAGMGDLAGGWDLRSMSFDGTPISGMKRDFRMVPVLRGQCARTCSANLRAWRCQPRSGELQL